MPHFPIRSLLIVCSLLLVEGDGHSAMGDESPARLGKSNRLARETSPYLLLHSHNPVDWYPWGPEAFAKAVAENKPIFLSIGYSSCYWCHVMERESFTDPEIAKLLNEKFISIKVDREERPDVDQVYMAALQAFGRGGWPMSMFLTPDGRPFFGGTYFPPRDREPNGGFLPLITEISRAWKSSRRHAEIEKSADSLTAAARQRLEAEGRSGAVPLTNTPAAEALTQMAMEFDPLHGGFGFDPQNPRRPKFPEPSNLLFLLDQHVRLTEKRTQHAAEKTAKSQVAKKTNPTNPASEAAPPTAISTAKDGNSPERSMALKIQKDNDKTKDNDKEADKDKSKEKPSDPKESANEPDPIDPLAMVLLTLDHMARGGIRDHLAGGYHRYSTERSWMVPHFEKMLYDNAQLASVHLAAFAITRDPRWRHEAEATLQFIERRMTSPDGAFYSALDAETQGEEGAYYVWTRDQVKKVVGPAGADEDAFLRVYGLTGIPNVPGERYVLREPLSLADQANALKTTADELEARLLPLRLRLLAARDRRPSPLIDDKVLTGWNGLMIAAYADAYRLLGTEKYRKSAETAAQFLLTKLRTPTGRLLRVYRAGVAKIPAYLDDYAFLIHGLLRLNQATHEEKWLREARALTDIMLVEFEDRQSGGFFFTSQGHDTLLARAKESYDNVLPSGNSLAVLDLIAVSRSTGVFAYLDQAGKSLSAFSSPLARKPIMLPAMLIGLEQYLDLRPTAKPTQDAKSVAATSHDPEPPVIKATALLDPASAAIQITPGSEISVSVFVEVTPGWHIHGNPPGVVNLKPTTLELDRSSRPIAQLIGVSYPVAEPTLLASLGNDKIALYSGKLTFKARVRLAKPLKPGAAIVKFILSYQACNDRLCLAPSTLEVSCEVPVTR